MSLGAYRRTQVEVTPGYKKPDTTVEKKLTKLQSEALNAIIALVDGGSTITIYNEDNKKVAGVGIHLVRVPTERYQRWPARDGLVGVSKATVKPLIAAGLLKAYNSRYSPDLVITEAGVQAAKSGVYGKVVNGDWVGPVMRDMTPEELRESDKVYFAAKAEHELERAKDTAETMAQRLEEAAKYIRQSVEGATIERAKAYGADDLYFANGIISRVHQTVSNLRFDVLTQSEARVAVALARLALIETNTTEDDE